MTEEAFRIINTSMKMFFIQKSSKIMWIFFVQFVF